MKQPKKEQQYPTRTVTITICTVCRQRTDRPHTPETCPRGPREPYILKRKGPRDPFEGPFFGQRSHS